MPHPVFTSFQYIGNALFDYEPVYHWIYEVLTVLMRPLQHFLVVLLLTLTFAPG